MFKLNGTLKVIGETAQVSEKFSKRDFVVTDNSSMYPQDIAFQLSQDKCDLLDTFKTGSIVEVSFNIRGREWTSPQGDVRYFNTLDAWRIELVSESATPMYKDPSPVSVPNVGFDQGSPMGDEDTLPF